jgi:hypothetical protein
MVPPRETVVVRVSRVLNAQLSWALLALVALALAGFESSVRLSAQAQTAAAEPATSSKTWLGHYKEFEDFLKNGEIDRIEEVKIGVTKPHRAYFKTGGLIESAAWKPLKPGMQRGFWESYKAEIAAYEIDKLLAMDMVPPAVERTIDGKTGAFIMWVTPTRMWKMGESDTPQTMTWSRQVVRMKMFDDFIGNIDRNAGNLLVDPMWNVILIDHSRALTDVKKLPIVLGRIDREFWTKMNSLTIESMTPALGPWMDKGEIKAIIERRNEMQKAIDELVKTKGEAAVFLPSPPPTSP